MNLIVNLELSERSVVLTTERLWLIGRTPAGIGIARIPPAMRGLCREN